MSTDQSKNKSEAVATIDSRQLLGDQSQVIIQHGDKQYRLYVTKENKLILTK